MIDRRRMIGALALLGIPSGGEAQTGPGFVGTWKGTVDGIGNATLIITGIGPGNLIEGRMEFELQSYQVTFADKMSPAQNASRGLVSGSSLKIDTALGGTYNLTLAGNRLAGQYTRGNTFNGKAEFSRQ